jgi:hypothetical protein
MRDFKGMKRQRGRNRGPGGGSGGNSGGKPQHNANRAFDSNGPEGIKVRGAAQGVFEKYQQLARDAATGGDRVLAENYLQHAEHYFRVLRAVQPQRPTSEIMVRDAFSSGYDIDFEAEPEFAAEAPAEAEADNHQGEGEAAREERPRDDRPREDRPRYNNDRPREDRQRDDRPRDDRPREDRPRYNNDRPREDRPRDDRPRYNNDRPRDDRPRDDRPREDRPRDDRPREDRAPRYERTERAAEPAPIADTQPISQPVARDSARLRGQDGAVSEAPAFLSRGAAPAPEPAAPVSDEAPKKRGRPRKAAAPSEDA